jgi:uncharacterized coiled-coil protein SlyX
MLTCFPAKSLKSLAQSPGQTMKRRIDALERQVAMQAIAMEPNNQTVLHREEPHAKFTGYDSYLHKYNPDSIIEEGRSLVLPPHALLDI